MLLANGSIGLGLAGKVGRTRSMFPRAKLFSTTEARFSEYPAHSLFSSAEGNKNSSRPCVSFKFVSFNPLLWFPLPNCNDFLMPHAGQFSAESLRESPWWSLDFSLLWWLSPLQNSNYLISQTFDSVHLGESLGCVWVPSSCPVTCKFSKLEWSEVSPGLFSYFRNYHALPAASTVLNISCFMYCVLLKSSGWMVSPVSVTSLWLSWK